MERNNQISKAKVNSYSVCYELSLESDPFDLDCNTIKTLPSSP